MTQDILETKNIEYIVQEFANRTAKEYLTTGLTENEINKNKLIYGKNTFSQIRKKPLIMRAVDLYSNPLNLLLLMASIMSFGIFLICPDDIPSLYLTFGIFLVSCINTGIEFYQEYTTNAILEGFKSMIPTKCRVIRDGQYRDINGSEIVMGDLVYCKMGDKIAADIRLLEVNNLKVDNSSITGESVPIEKSIVFCDSNTDQAQGMVLSGNLVVDGDGKGIVVNVGDNTVLGRIAKMTMSEEHSKSELSCEIERFVKRLGIIAVFTSLLFYLIARYNRYSVCDNLALCVGIFIAFVPQGLPATVTILMTISAKRLAKSNVLVKDLRAVETLGSISMLATDKTGTLTEGKMTCVSIWDGTNLNTIDNPENKEIENLASLCFMTSKVIITANGDILGDPTEIALYNFALLYSRMEKIQPVKQILFNSDTKYQTSFFEMGTDYKIVLKGAPERVIALCSNYEVNSTIKQIDNNFNGRYFNAYNKLAGEGQRVIGIAEKVLPKDGVDINDTHIIQEFTFVSLIGIVDPPKHGVKDAIIKLRLAGIQTVMVTGDHPLTAEFIARQICILSHDTSTKTSPAEIVTGEELAKFTQNDWQRVLSKKELVFARTTPKDKLIIVEKFQEIGHIVGACGDGVNDSPALKRSNLGISMNKTGSEVSKEAASMIILDDNFSSIVGGVLEGRLIFCNLKKSIKYIVSHITPQVIPYLLFVSIGIPSPMSTLLLMFIDLFTEFFPAIFLAFEEPEDNLMIENPRKIDKIDSAKHFKEGKTITDHYAEYNDREMQEIEKTKLMGQNLGKSVTPGFSMINTLKTKKRGQSLCDINLVSWSYLEAGLLITLGGIISFFTVLLNEGIPTYYLTFSSNVYFKHGSPDIPANRLITHAVQREILYKAQSAYFLSILIGQCFNLLACKRKEILSKKSFRNLSPIIGSVFGLLFGYFIVYTTVCNKYLYSRPVEVKYFIGPLVTGVLLLLWDLIRKSLIKDIYHENAKDINTIISLKKAGYG